MYQMRQGHHNFYSLAKIQKELTKLIENPKPFCDISNATNVQGSEARSYKCTACPKENVTRGEADNALG